ncbi:hypothetical protein [uncultured Selenomonas sp.]|uniref:hypothetical protein n=1 Tax=uncultured Selenomonas sp. TaxID=159275 RepID=UPI0025F90DD6|nr:hypothetical protein [uncultured Selenomonas sp.]
MKKKNMVVSGVLAAVVAVSGQFVQVGQGNGIHFGTQSAAAFGLKMPKIKTGISSVDDQANKAAKQTAENAVKKAFNVDISSMGNRKQDMLKHLAWAARLEAVSADRWGKVAGTDTAEAQAASNSAQAFLANGDFSLSTFKNFSSNYQSKMKLSDNQKQAYAALDKALVSEKDKLTTEQNKTYVTDAKKARKMAAVYNALAVRDAGLLLSDTAKALAHKSDLGSQLDEVQELASFANEAKSFVDAQKKISKERADLTKKAEKAMNVKEPTEQENKDFAKTLGME